MGSVAMREVREGEVPFDGGTALQEDPDRPAFRGNGPDDYVCVRCGNVLAASMHGFQMTKKVRVKCGVCETVNVAATGD
jgi:ribosomal protein S27AE